jgi:hypothetical protein
MARLPGGWQRAGRLAILPGGEVSEWFKVPLSKSGVVLSHRGFESHPLRQERPLGGRSFITEGSHSLV